MKASALVIGVILYILPQMDVMLITDVTDVTDRDVDLA